MMQSTKLITRQLLSERQKKFALSYCNKTDNGIGRPTRSETCQNVCSELYRCDDDDDDNDYYRQSKFVIGKQQ